MGSRQAGDRHAEGRAADIVVADDVAELDRVGVAAMLAADAHFQVGAGLAAIVDRHLHQAANAIAVDGLEGILGQDALRHVGDQEVALGVIAGVAEGHLGQVVGAEGEELGQTRQSQPAVTAARGISIIVPNL